MLLWLALVVCVCLIPVFCLFCFLGIGVVACRSGFGVGVEPLVWEAFVFFDLGALVAMLFFLLVLGSFVLTCVCPPGLCVLLLGCWLHI